MADDRSFRRDFFRQVADHPLEPTDPRYHKLYEPESDVILHLKETIDFSEGRSTQLLSGYRGAGKSTELRRLRNLLQADGHVVLLIDIEDFLDLHTPIDITTFLLALCGAIGEALREHLVGDVLKASLGERLWNFLKSEVKLKELSLTAKAGGKAKTDDGEVEGGLEAAAKLELKTNPLFRQKIQESLSLSLGHFRRRGPRLHRRVRHRGPPAAPHRRADRPGRLHRARPRHQRDRSQGAREPGASVRRS
jgi:hypothetical protein